MESFEELSLSPDLVEALAAEGIETPTALQVDVMPVVSRGNDVVAVAGPGAGVLIATGVPLLGRLEGEGNSPVALILTAMPDRSVGMAQALGRFTPGSSHRVASLDGSFALPSHASVLISTPSRLLEEIRQGNLTVEGVQAVIVDDAAGLEVSGMLSSVETILDAVPSSGQKIMIALPYTPALDALVNKHFKKAVKVPPGAQGIPTSPDRGQVNACPVEGTAEDTLLRAVADSLAHDIHHVVVFVRSEDNAADVGDRLTLRGFLAGRPGDADAPIWMAVDALEARAAIEAADDGTVALVSLDVPADEDELDRRHGAGRGGLVVVAPRELPHLRAMARRAGYAVGTKRYPASTGVPGSLGGLLAQVDEAITSKDVDVYQTALDGLFARHGAPSVAGALLALLREKPAAPQAPASEAPESDLVRLFISIGSRDGIGAGDLMGAITGESGVKGSQIGRIDLKESFSLVEVRKEDAPVIIKALNGHTIKGRATRVDLDRTERTGSGGGRPGGGRPGGRPGGSGGGRPGGRPGGSGGGRPGGGGPPRRSGPPRRD